MRYELHCHTYYSRCSLLTPSAILERCRIKKLDGVCIVDHNIFLGALEVESANHDKGFKVIKGIEFSTKMGHVIGLFLSHEIIYDRKKHSVNWLIDKIHEQNGLAILAHPYSLTRSFNIESEKIIEHGFDAIECFNGRNIFAYENEKAKRLAKGLNLPCVAGSDAHFDWEIGNNVVECDDLYKDLKNGSISMECKNSLVSFRSIFNQILSFKLKLFRRLLGMLFR